jgi:hypothetical protein
MTRRVTLAVLLLLLAGCSFDNAPQAARLPTVAQPVSAKASTVQNVSLLSAAPAGSSAGGLLSPPQTTCPIPAGWLPYQMQVNETIYSVAARANLSADGLLRTNCLPATATAGPGTWLYVPPQAVSTRPQTSLPLGIGAFVADPLVVPAGGVVRLAWQAVGPAVRVRVGWVYQDQFVQEADNLPQVGVWQFQVPADGREAMTFAVRASDGLHEVAAQTTVQVRCPEGWFFNPQPSGCPLPSLVTTFYEQPFERGTIVYIPALGVHYALVTGQPARQIASTFLPGMPLKDPARDAGVPAGLRQPTGAINYAWRSDKALQTALGYAVGEPHIYTGLFQRAVMASGEATTFSAASGQVYVIALDDTWSLVTSQ